LGERRGRNLFRSCRDSESPAGIFRVRGPPSPASPKGSDARGGARYCSHGQLRFPNMVEKARRSLRVGKTDRRPSRDPRSVAGLPSMKLWPGRKSDAHLISRAILPDPGFFFLQNDRLLMAREVSPANARARWKPKRARHRSPREMEIGRLSP